MKKYDILLILAIVMFLICTLLAILGIYLNTHWAIYLLCALGFWGGYQYLSGWLYSRKMDRS